MGATVIAAIIAILSSASLGWSVISDDLDSITVASLSTVFAIYILVLAAFSVPQNTASSHTPYIVHLAILCAFSALILTTVTIMPSTPFVTAQTAQLPLLSLLDTLWTISVGLYVILAVIYFTTPLGPPLYFPASQIYSDKTVEATTNTDPENVSGEVGASCWDILFFSFNTKVVKLGNVAESMEIGDIPIVPASIRATYNFAAMRRVMRTVKPKWLWWSFKPGSGWGLLYRLYVANRTAMLMVFLLAAVSAVLFYAPAFFLQRTVAYLETDPERLDRRWGFLFSFGLFVSWSITCLSKLSPSLI